MNLTKAYEVIGMVMRNVSAGHICFSPYELSSAKICWSYVIHLNVSALSNSQSHVLAASFFLFCLSQLFDTPSYVHPFFLPQRLICARINIIYIMYTNNIRLSRRHLSTFRNVFFFCFYIFPRVAAPCYLTWLTRRPAFFSANA